MVHQCGRQMKRKILLSSLILWNAFFIIMELRIGYLRKSVQKETPFIFSQKLEITIMKFTHISRYSLHKVQIIFPQNLLHYQHNFSTFITGLNCRKWKIRFPLHSAPKLYITLVKFCINLKEITVADILYQCCRLIKKKILRYFQLRSLFYSYCIRHIQVNQKK